MYVSRISKIGITSTFICSVSVSLSLIPTKTHKAINCRSNPIACLCMWRLVGAVFYPFLSMCAGVDVCDHIRRGYCHGMNDLRTGWLKIHQNLTQKRVLLFTSSRIRGWTNEFARRILSLSRWIGENGSNKSWSRRSRAQSSRIDFSNSPCALTAHWSPCKKFTPYSKLA